MAAADVVFLGEYHDDPVAHALQLELLRRAAGQLGYQQAQPSGISSNSTSRAPAESDKQHQGGSAIQQQIDTSAQPQQQQPSKPLVLSLEMFERDVQTVLDEYLAGTISQRDLLRDSRPWPNYTRDYAPLVEFCRHNHMHVVAANAPRRYVSVAGRRGREALEQLSPEAKGYLAPLPYAQPSQRYLDKVHSTMKQAAQEMQKIKQQRQQVKQQQDRQREQAILQPPSSTGSTGSCGDSGSSDDTGNSPTSRDRDQQDPIAPIVVAAAAAPPSAAAIDEVRKGTPAAAAVEAAPEADPSGACPYIGFNVSSNFTDAQVLWDATMAHSIAQQLLVQSAVGPADSLAEGVVTCSTKITADGLHHKPWTAIAAEVNKPLVIHVCGKFHCEEGLGIPEHLANYAPGTRMLSIIIVPSNIMQPTPEEFDQSGLKGLRDYVVVTDASLPRSFDSVHPV